MRDRQRRAVLVSGGLLTVGIVALAVFVLLPGDQPATDAAVPTLVPGQVAGRFLDELASGRSEAAGALTDDPSAAARHLAAVWAGLRPTQVVTTLREPAGDQAPFEISWSLGGDRTWRYASTIPLVRKGEQWVVHWTPAIVHPQLLAGHSLALRTRTGQPAVLDRDGAPLLTWQASGPAAVDSGLAPVITPGMARVADEQGGIQSWHIALIDAAGQEVSALGGSAGHTVAPLSSTLSVPVQNAAQAAVGSVGQPALLVAIQSSTGHILAVAQNSAAGTTPQALNGLYPPGSTFKVATAAAVLRSGIANLTTVLPCPGTVTVGQRTIPNAGFDLGAVPLRTAFARSCNTTFATLAADLPPDALSTAASQLGLNADFAVPGLTTETGAVRPAGSTAEQVENGIGQGRVLVSPFGLALMTATVASGKALTPTLWRDLPTTVNEGYQPPPDAVVGGLRTMMRDVVTVGTGRDLARYGPVAGKTGTAQFGADALHAHGWFTGYRSDLAFAVLVESAETAAPAVAVAGAFLAAAP